MAPNRSEVLHFQQRVPANLDDLGAGCLTQFLNLGVPLSRIGLSVDLPGHLGGMWRQLGEDILGGPDNQGELGALGPQILIEVSE